MVNLRIPGDPDALSINRAESAILDAERGKLDTTDIALRDRSAQVLDAPVRFVRPPSAERGWMTLPKARITGSEDELESELQP